VNPSVIGLPAICVHLHVPVETQDHSTFVAADGLPRATLRTSRACVLIATGREAYRSMGALEWCGSPALRRCTKLFGFNVEIDHLHRELAKKLLHGNRAGLQATTNSVQKSNVGGADQQQPNKQIAGWSFRFDDGYAACLILVGNIHTRHALVVHSNNRRLTGRKEGRNG
jgi:hypothetical protein